MLLHGCKQRKMPVRAERDGGTAGELLLQSDQHLYCDEYAATPTMKANGIVRQCQTFVPPAIYIRLSAPFNADECCCFSLIPTNRIT
uniref:Uncharacterized protein n=1 Tax=Panagrellus redivivus TaxID=6233 RepID=A0A7E4W6S7_PANRE